LKRINVNRDGVSHGVKIGGLRGEAGFATTLRQRVTLLEGMPEARVDAAFERCELRRGAANTIADLHRSGVSVAVITGRFERGVKTALRRAGITGDHVVANRLVPENEAVAGDVEGPLLDSGSDHALGELASTEGVDLGQTVAVENGATDLPMRRVAGTAIGFNPGPVVEPDSDVVATPVRKRRLHFEHHGLIDSSESSDGLQRAAVSLAKRRPEPDLYL
jgi:phosphoserine phosphatase